VLLLRPAVILGWMIGFDVFWGVTAPSPKPTHLHLQHLLPVMNKIDGAKILNQAHHTMMAALFSPSPSSSLSSHDPRPDRTCLTRYLPAVLLPEKRSEDTTD